MLAPGGRAADVTGAGAAVTSPASASAPAATKSTIKHRIVFQVNVADEEVWNEVLTNVENVQRAFGSDQVAIEIVAHGKGSGLALAANTAIAQRVSATHATGTTVALCSNTMKKQNIAPGDLTSGVVVVDSGIAEIVRRVEDGWVYIKAGH
jgi:hypothetical protein